MGHSIQWYVVCTYYIVSLHNLNLRSILMNFLKFSECKIFPPFLLFPDWQSAAWLCLILICADPFSHSIFLRLGGIENKPSVLLHLKTQYCFALQYCIPGFLKKNSKTFLINQKKIKPQYKLNGAKWEKLKVPYS